MQELNGNKMKPEINLLECGYVAEARAGGEPIRNPAPLHRWAQAVTGSLLAVNQFCTTRSNKCISEWHVTQGLKKNVTLRVEPEAIAKRA